MVQGDEAGLSPLGLLAYRPLPVLLLPLVLYKQNKKERKGYRFGERRCINCVQSGHVLPPSNVMIFNKMNMMNSTPRGAANERDHSREAGKT